MPTRESEIVVSVQQILDQVRQVVVGKDEALLWALAAILSGGHILLEDIPGVGKTTMALSFARALDLEYGRIQFTPDVLPSDVTGYSVPDPRGGMEYRPGGILCNLFLADELNRATSRTQSALLEAMEERQITVDGVTSRLAEPFMVLATQNPLESFGTFPLPDAQMDRFFMRLSLGYMTREQELEVLSRPSAQTVLNELQAVVTPEETAYVRTAYREVKVSEEVKHYLMDIVEATRTQSGFVSGVSTRGALALYQAAQAYAALQGREYVIPEDIKGLAPAVLSHRISLGSSMNAEAAALGAAIDRAGAELDLSALEGVHADEGRRVHIDVERDVPRGASEGGGEVFGQHVLAGGLAARQQQVFAAEQGGQRLLPHLSAVVDEGRGGDAGAQGLRQRVGGTVFFHSAQQVGGDPFLPQRIH